MNINSMLGLSKGPYSLISLSEASMASSRQNSRYLPASPEAMYSIPALQADNTLDHDQTFVSTEYPSLSESYYPTSPYPKVSAAYRLEYAGDECAAAVEKLNTDLGYTSPPLPHIYADRFNLDLDALNQASTRLRPQCIQQDLDHPAETHESCPPLLHVSAQESLFFQQTCDYLCAELLKNQQKFYSGRVFDLVTSVLSISKNAGNLPYGTIYEGFTGLRYWEVYSDGSKGLFQEWIELFRKTAYLKLVPLEVQLFYNQLPQKIKRGLAELSGMDGRVFLGMYSVPTKKNPRVFLYKSGNDYPQALGKRDERDSDSSDDDDDTPKPNPPRKQRRTEARRIARTRSRLSTPDVRSGAPAVNIIPEASQYQLGPRILQGPPQIIADLTTAAPPILPQPAPIPQAPALAPIVWTGPINALVIQPQAGIPLPMAPAGPPQQPQAPPLDPIMSAYVRSLVPGLLIPTAPPAHPLYQPTARGGSAGTCHYGWTDVRKAAYRAKHMLGPNDPLPTAAYSTNYNPAHTGTPENTNYRLFGACQITMAELLAYLPLSLAVNEVGNRCDASGYFPSEIIEYIYWTRQITDIEAIKRPTLAKQIKKSKDWAAARLQANNAPTATFALGNLDDANCLSGALANDPLDYIPIASLGDNVVHHPTGRWAGVLTQAIARCIWTNDRTTTLSQFVWYCQTHGIIDHNAHLRNPNVRVEDAETRGHFKDQCRTYFRSVCGKHKSS